MEFLEYPCLRSDLERHIDHPGQPEELLIYDPARRALFELDAADLPVLALLDGSRTPREIARQAGRPLDPIHDLIDDLADLLLLEDPEQDDLLDELRRAHQAEDDLLQPILDSQPLEGPERAVRIVDDARHTCVFCGACCHYAVPVSPEERRRLGAVDWPEGIVPKEAGRLFQLRPGLQWGRLESVIATRRDPIRCAFLDEEDLCRVHRELGPAAKPFPCRLFPLAYPVCAPDGLIVSLTFECPFVYRSYESGERLAGRAEELRALVAEMEEVYVLPQAIPLERERTLDLVDYLAWEGELLSFSAAPATAPAAFLERLQAHWAQFSPAEPGPAPTRQALAELATVMGRALRENRAALVGSPEGEEGAAWAGRVLEALGERPELAWEPLPWTDGPAADRFLGHFVHHYLEGKQHLFYRPLWVGLRALSVLLLLSRADAGLMAPDEISLDTLNRALARWCRMLDIRPLRVAFLAISNKR